MSAERGELSEVREVVVALRAASDALLTILERHGVSIEQDVNEQASGGAS